MSTAHREEVNRVLAELSHCAHASDEIVGLAVVGSWARGTSNVTSDLDVLVLGDVEKLVGSQPWSDVTASAELIRTKTFGSVEERRYRFPSGLVLELDVTPTDWATTPIEAGTRRVVSDGMCILVDQKGLLRSLAQAL